MRFYACLACETCYQVAGSLDELMSTWAVVEMNGGPSCPTQLCQGKLMRLTGPAEGFELKEIPLQTFFRAVNGFGSPEGQAAAVSRFRELITTKKVVEVHASPAGKPERVILHRLVLEDGTRLHFDTSAKGACCYYIEEPGPSCLEVFDNESERESSDSNREEARRTSEIGIAPSPKAGVSSTSNAAAAECSEPRGVPAVPKARDVSEPGRPTDQSDGPS